MRKAGNFDLDEFLAKREDAIIHHAHLSHPAQRPRDSWGRINGLGCVCQDCDRYREAKGWK